jgi:hypothetical protein
MEHMVPSGNENREERSLGNAGKQEQKNQFESQERMNPSTLISAFAFGYPCCARIQLFSF